MLKNLAFTACFWLQCAAIAYPISLHCYGHFLLYLALVPLAFMTVFTIAYVALVDLGYDVLDFWERL